jgi:predicted dehydrogenase
MGKNHARVIDESHDAELGIVIDRDLGAAKRLGSERSSRASAELGDAMFADAIVIATSASSHVACALPFVEAGKPVFIEKPLAPTLAEVEQLLDVAERRDTPVMCGFVERFNAAFVAAAGQLNTPPTHMLAVRHSPPAPRIVSSVVSDLLLHDLDLAVQLFGDTAMRMVGAACWRPTPESFPEIVDCTLSNEAGGIASLSANRMGQRKVRTLAMHAANQLIEVDLLRQDVTIYRNVSQEMVQHDGGVGYRSSTEVDIPFVRHLGEPLSLQFEHFLRLVNGRGDHALERARIHPPHALMDSIEQTPQAS